MMHDESWGKMRPTWGTAEDIAELNNNFDKMEAFSKQNDIPAFVGEFAPAYGKDPLSRARWMLGVADAALSRNMVPVALGNRAGYFAKAAIRTEPQLNVVLRSSPPPDSISLLRPPPRC